MKNFVRFLCIIFLFISCVNKDYDKDISTEVELFSNGLELPIGETNPMKVDTLLKDIEFLFIDGNGDYFLSLSDSFSATVPDFDRSKLHVVGKTHSNILGNPEESSINALPGFSMKSTKSDFTDLKYTYQDTFSLNFNSEMPEELIAFRNAKFKNQASIDVSIGLSNVPPSFINENIDISFEAKVPELININPDNPNDNTFRFSGKIKGDAKLSKSILYDEFNQEIYFTDGRFIYSELVTSKIVLGVSEINGTPTPEDILKLKDIQINFTVKVSDIHIKSIIGKINVDVDSEEVKIDMSSLSDLLGKNNNSVLDLFQTDIRMNAKTQLNIPLIASLKLTPIKNNSSLAPQQVLLNLKQGDKNFFISNKPELAPAGYETHQMDVPALLKNIPDQIKVEWFGKTDTSIFSTFDFESTYNVQAKYSINVPLAFGNDFCITFKDTIDFNVEDNIETLDMFLKNGSIEIYGEVRSTFPLNIKMILKGMDTFGIPINDLTYEKEIPATNFSIRLQAAQLESLKNVKFWEVSFNAQVPENKAGVIISRNDYIQLLNFKLRKKGGIILNDMDDLKF